MMSGRALWNIFYLIFVLPTSLILLKLYVLIYRKKICVFIALITKIILETPTVNNYFQNQIWIAFLCH